MSKNMLGIGDHRSICFINSGRYGSFESEHTASQLNVRCIRPQANPYSLVNTDVSLTAGYYYLWSVNSNSAFLVSGVQAVKTSCRLPGTFGEIHYFGNSRPQTRRVLLGH